MKKSDWVYVSRKLNGRGRKVTSVYHNEIPIDTAKVSKNISRYVHPNDEFKSGKCVSNRDLLNLQKQLHNHQVPDILPFARLANQVPSTSLTRPKALTQLSLPMVEGGRMPSVC